MALWYAPAIGKALGEEINYLTDDVRATLHTSAYVPNRDTHDYVNDLTNELATTGGYTAGGMALGSKTVTTTAANSWADTWAASTAVDEDYVIRPTTGNGRLYRCVVAGTMGGTEPTWTTVVGADQPTDGTVTWECVGRAIIALNCAAITWATATFTGARYLVVSDRTPATDATRPLIGLIDFGIDESGQGGSFTVTPDAQGLLHVFVP